MNICVESLYTLDDDTDKRRMMEMIQVMQGAIYLSKSQTGEVIYRYNRYEKKILDKQLAIFDKGISRAKNNAESQKRDILRKWSLVFGKKRAIAESIRNFDQMLITAIELRDTTKHDGYKEPVVIEEPIRIDRKETKILSNDANLDQTLSIGLRKNRHRSITPLGQHRPSKPEALRRFRKAVLPMLPRKQAEELEARWRKEAEEERRNALPKFEKSMIDGFLQKQHKLHEDLLTRNAVCQIKNNLDIEHPFYKHRLKGKLPESAELLVQTIERKRAESRLSSPRIRTHSKSPRIKSANTISISADINNLSRPLTDRPLKKRTYSNIRPKTVHVTRINV